MDERADLDHPQARRRQAGDPTELALGGHGLLLDLQAVAEPHFVNGDVSHGESDHRVPNYSSLAMASAISSDVLEPPMS